MNLQPVFERFASLLRERLAARAFTTEDSVRYSFYCALASEGVYHTDMILEYPHPSLPGAEIDTVIRPSGERPPLAFEFKYDRANPGGRNQNRTQRAGAVFRDIFRLAKVPPEIATAKYFIYATDSEMAGYFRNPANRLAEMFESGVEPMRYGQSVFSGFSQTFLSSIAELCCDCHVSRVFSADLDTHCVRVWSVT
jgi:hypothetical protein